MYTMDEKLVTVSQQDLVLRAVGKSYLDLDARQSQEKRAEKRSQQSAYERKPVRTRLPAQRSLLLRLLSILIKF